MVSDPAAAKHVLRSTDNPNRPIYVKGLVAEVTRHSHSLLDDAFDAQPSRDQSAQHAALDVQVSEFLFGHGFAISGGDEWRVRRKAVGPSLHKAYLAEMTDRVFGPSAQALCNKLEVLPTSCHPCPCQHPSGMVHVSSPCRHAQQEQPLSRRVVGMQKLCLHCMKVAMLAMPDKKGAFAMCRWLLGQERA